MSGLAGALMSFFFETPEPPVRAEDSPTMVPIKTYDDILANLSASADAVAADTKAAADRQAKFASDSDALKSAFDADSATIADRLKGDAADRDAADAALKLAVKDSGGLAHVNADGLTVTAYEPDGAGSYTTKTLRLSTQPVPPPTS